MDDNWSFDGNGTNLSCLFFTSLVEYLFSILSSFLNREMGIHRGAHRKQGE
jgi:hypothetical protein